MRKRTYTALDGPTGSVSEWDTSHHVTHTEKKNGVHMVKEGGVASSVSSLSVLRTPGSPLGATKPDSLFTQIPVKQVEREFDTCSDDIPLTTIHNLVGTCQIFSSVQPIDLDYLYACMPNSYYNRTRFAAGTIKCLLPTATGLLFTSGKLVITGAKSLIECNLAALRLVRCLQRHIPNVTFSVHNVEIQNVVAHVVLPLKVGQKLNVDRLYAEHACKPQNLNPITHEPMNHKPMLFAHIMCPRDQNILHKEPVYARAYTLRVLSVCPVGTNFYDFHCTHHDHITTLVDVTRKKEIMRGRDNNGWTQNG